ncbi:MAG TPA: ClpXP protease specificity-enhancing factor SspB [Hyphomicrobium sp.]|nr:ClpXP protease specificity-enhancing factor SspB [Hyphomicrobium sp.]
MASEPTIDYETLTQDAMRGVVRTVLTQAAKSGLPGDHHFYISFDTSASGVVLSKRLKDKYPSEMTIVLQHRFWDLSVEDDGFEVKLTFDGIPERLVVPFAALRVFFDPSVRYGLQFEDPDVEPEAGEDMSNRFGGRGSDRLNGARATLRSTAPKKPKVARKTKDAKPEKAAPPAPAAHKAEKAPAAAVPAPRLAAVPSKPAEDKGKRSEPKPADKPAEDRPRQDNGGAQIVSLDAFRKK